MFKFSNENYAYFSVSEKAYAKTTTIYSPGISFYSYDGETWTDLCTEKSAVAWIKAFTIDTPNKLDLSYTANDETEVTITAKINSVI